MADDTAKTAQDRKFINVNEAYELRYWQDALKVDEKALRDAVAAVGTSAAAVRQHLDKAD